MVPDDIEPPHPNGAVHSSGESASRAGRRHAPWEFTILALFVALIGVGIILAWTLVGSHSPERLNAAAGAQVSDACANAQRALTALPNSFPRTGADRVARIRDEDVILREMVARIRAVQVAGTPGAAIRGWTTDWANVVDARERYAADLERDGKAQLVLPSSAGGSGLKPVTAKMDDFVRENHPRIDACITSKVQLEQVEGPRVYGKDTTG